MLMVFRSSSGITYLSILHEDHQRRLSFNLGVTQKLLMVWDPVASLCQRKPRTPPSVSLGSKGSPFPLLCIKYRREYVQWTGHQRSSAHLPIGPKHRPLSYRLVDHNNTGRTWFLSETTQTSTDTESVHGSTLD